MACKSFERELHDRVNQSTPYGPLIVQQEATTLGGESLVVDFLNPHAWLYHACDTIPRYAKFMARHCTETLSAVFYDDETKPGNVLRPDLARSFVGIYWIVKEFPERVRNKQAFWIPIVYLKSKDLKLVKGGISALYVQIFDLFWGDLNLEHGVLLPGFRIQLKFGFFLHDGKANKETFGVKGAGGLKCCMACLNCGNFKANSRGKEMLVHYKDPDMSLFVRHTCASFSALVDELVAARPHMTKTEFQALGKSAGINLDECVLARSHHRERAQVPMSAYPDWFHNLLASGGVFQYQLNSFIWELYTVNIDPADLDQFAANIDWHAKPKLSAKFFQDRTQKAGRHIKAFASEVISAIEALHLFVLVALPNGVLPDHVKLFLLMVDIVHVLSLGDLAIHFATELDNALAEHHALFIKLYATCAKPKIHWNRHVVDAMLRHGVNMSCGAPERLHRFTKDVSKRIYNSFANLLLRQVVAVRIR